MNVQLYSTYIAITIIAVIWLSIIDRPASTF